ncbi:MAG TPA: TetR/AcrR family transcriptional regulator [Bacteroidales bacterium]|nr:TetR/AcrR family transcriptional regulator [Bacteroidales bacterium]HPS18194.1 TetR/AcrR family transcriptional regulator [Bacteroidales bacterium]
MEEVILKISQLYMKYGIRSVTMDDVAKELGISKKTLYQYFKDKDDLVQKVVSHYMNMLMEGLNKLEDNTNNAIENLLQMSRYLTQMLKQANTSVTFDLQKYYPEIWSKTIMNRMELVYELTKSNMLQGIKEGLYRSNLDVDIIAHLYLFRIEMTKLFEKMQEKNFSFENIFKELFIYHIRGIANKKGIEYLEKKLNIDERQ